jgi:hypothetical protein
MMLPQTTPRVPRPAAALLKLTRPLATLGEYVDDSEPTAVDPSEGDSCRPSAPRPVAILKPGGARTPSTPPRPVERGPRPLSIIKRLPEATVTTLATDDASDAANDHTQDITLREVLPPPLPSRKVTPEAQIAEEQLANERAAEEQVVEVQLAEDEPIAKARLRVFVDAWERARLFAVRALASLRKSARRMEAHLPRVRSKTGSALASLRKYSVAVLVFIVYVAQAAFASLIASTPRLVARVRARLHAEWTRAAARADRGWAAQKQS